MRETYLDVVALVVITAFAEQSVVDYAVNVKLVQQRIAILDHNLDWKANKDRNKRTFDTDAVNTTTSYSSPTLFMNASTPGRLMT
jgi:hypothetical protein